MGQSSGETAWALVMVSPGMRTKVEESREKRTRNVKKRPFGDMLERCVVFVFIPFFVPIMPALILLFRTLTLTLFSATLLLLLLYLVFLWKRDVLPVCGRPGTWSGSFELKDNFYTRYIQPALSDQESLPYRERKPSQG